MSSLARLLRRGSVQLNLQQQTTQQVSNTIAAIDQQPVAEVVNPDTGEVITPAVEGGILYRLTELRDDVGTRRVPADANAGTVEVPATGLLGRATSLESSVGAPLVPADPVTGVPAVPASGLFLDVSTVQGTLGEAVDPVSGEPSGLFATIATAEETVAAQVELGPTGNNPAGQKLEVNGVFPAYRYQYDAMQQSASKSVELLDPKFARLHTPGAPVDSDFVMVDMHVPLHPGSIVGTSDTTKMPPATMTRDKAAFNGSDTWTTLYPHSVATVDPTNPSLSTFRAATENLTKVDVMPPQFCGTFISGAQNTGPFVDPGVQGTSVYIEDDCGRWSCDSY